MKTTIRFAVLAAIAGALFVAGYSVGLAAEHPGSSTMEHPGKGIKSDSVKKATKDFIDARTKANGGVFPMHDDKLDKEWKLTFVKIHDPVRQYEEGGKTIYFACTDFKSVDSKDILDIDLWMVAADGKLEVIDTKLHKVNGEARYTYEGTRLKPLK